VLRCETSCCRACDHAKVPLVSDTTKQKENGRFIVQSCTGIPNGNGRLSLFTDTTSWQVSTACTLSQNRRMIPNRIVDYPPTPDEDSSLRPVSDEPDVKCKEKDLLQHLQGVMPRPVTKTNVPRNRLSCGSVCSRKGTGECRKGTMELDWKKRADVGTNLRRDVLVSHLGCCQNFFETQLEPSTRASRLARASLVHLDPSPF
jgi:hypothetical protein